ncbi:MAG: hypothetical protein KatS3mg011_1301 [Acidimicrobiia bacterium]|nr:MAG: hypothetical protein KatS3mg011_1301 [Acidimicrobiia bacterium]
MDTTVFLIVAAVVVIGLVLVVALRDRSSTTTPARVPDVKERLAKARRSLTESLRRLGSRGSVDEAFWSQLEETLISADVGVATSGRLVARVRESRPADTQAALDTLRAAMVEVLSDRDRSLRLEGNPAVVLVVGVNGTGKTTTIAKLAHHLMGEGRSVLLAAADTFRAAAVDQLRTWAERIGCDCVAGGERADPAAVAFDAYQAARARGRDVVIVDTAGRLHAKGELMEQLAKIKRVLDREAGSVDEVLLVLDATAGQNGIVQAERFLEVVGVTGLVLAKLDGTAKGGIVLAIESSLGLPVKFVGIGEGMEDLVPFEPAAFVEALLGDL